MAYRKRTKTFRRRRPTRRFRRKTYVPRLIKHWVETKKNIASYTEVQMTSASTFPGTYIDGGMLIGQGTTMCTRLGNWVNGIGIKTRFLMHNNANNPQFVRYLMLVNKQGSANIDYSTGTALFDNNSGTNTNLSSFTTNGYLVRRINRDKYHVLQDKVFRLGGALDRDKMAVHNKYIRLKGRKYNYDGTTAVCPTQRNIVEIWLTGEADDDAVGEVVELTGEQTFYFTDA